MNLNAFFNRTLWVVVFIGVALYLIWHQFRKKNELEQHAVEQNLLNDINGGVNTIDNVALMAYPLSTIGLEPLAGIEYDPFNPDSIASKPHALELEPSTPQAGSATWKDQISALLNTGSNPFLFNR
jgi:hypothetical protein